jgi:hypothetical protein
MKPLPKPKERDPKGPIEILEEAVELLRQAPVSALAAYYLGSVPFGLGFLYFWADMSRSSLAYQTLPQEAFGVALLFLWMKTWQTVFTRALWATLAQGQEPRWTAGRLLRTVLFQAVLQPWGFLAIPIAGLLLIPYPWVYAFFQNVTVLGEGSADGLKDLYRQSWKMANLWPRQNGLMLGTVSLFALFVLSNLFLAFYMAPSLLKELLGIQTLFLRSGSSFFNTTFLAIVYMSAYLCLDPLMKAVYTLRCFYGESLYNGEDLKSELKLMGAPARVLLVAAFLLAGGLFPARGGNPAPAPGVSAAELDKAIGETLKGEQYQWHMPRVKPEETKVEQRTLLGKFLDGSLRLFVRVMQKIGHWIVEFFDWIGSHFHHDTTGPDKKIKSSEWDFEWLYAFSWVLLAVVACALALLLYRLWTRREKGVVLGEAVMPVPDVADERVSGSELPMDGWLALAQDLFRQGHFRLALRAFYLATLACLARQKLVTIAKFKSTGDYERELNRRGHSLPRVIDCFSENGRSFDRGWYGDYQVTRDLVDAFAANHERIRREVEPDGNLNAQG